MITYGNVRVYKLVLGDFYDRLTFAEKQRKCNMILPTKSTYISQNLDRTTFVVPDGDLIGELLSDDIIRTFLAVVAPVHIVINPEEHGAPFTLNKFIHFPHTNFSLTEFKQIFKHELCHIYFHLNHSQTLEDFRMRKGLVKINRSRRQHEITNPDTFDYEGLQLIDRIIYPVLYSPTHYELFVDDRKATAEEIELYNAALPYRQNYHSEEIFAELISQYKK